MAKKKVAKKTKSPVRSKSRKASSVNHATIEHDFIIIVGGGFVVMMLVVFFFFLS